MTIKFVEAKKLSSELIGLAQNIRDDGLSLQAHHAAWTTCFSQGEFAEMIEHASVAERLYDPEIHKSHAYRYGGHDPGVCAMNLSALANWILGYPDNARRLSQEALRLAHARDHPFSLGTALGNAAILAQFCGEVENTLSHAKTANAVAEEHGFTGSLWTGGVSAVQAWAQAEKGEELAALESGRMVLERKGPAYYRPFYLSNYAAICLKFEKHEDALAALDEALELVERSGERWWEPEIHRQKGETLWRQGVDSAEFAPHFERATDVARRQKARSLELRAVMSVARMHANRNERTEAKSALAPVFAWFTEGFDTSDLNDAKTLLDGLS